MKRSPRMSRVGARVATLTGLVVGMCGFAGSAAYAGGGGDVVGGSVMGSAAAPTVSYTLYGDDAGAGDAAVTVVTVDVHGFADPALDAADTNLVQPAAGDGGGTVCTMYLTAPHATPQSPRDGDLYLEGEAHTECASTKVSVHFATAIEWRLEYGTNGEDGSSGTHYNQGPSASCSSGSRCPANSDIVAPWAHMSACWETGRYYATTVILSGSYTYGKTTYDLAGLRSGTTSGTYGRAC